MRPKKKQIPAWLCILSAALFPLVLSAQTIEVKDGARIIHNIKGGRWGAAPNVDLELIRKIGDIDTQDENLAFNMPRDLIEDSQGNIFIVDTSNHRIQKFDKNMKWLASLGRKGQGPGEFSSLSSLNIDASDRLYVLDDRRRMLKILSADGQEIKTMNFVKTPVDAIRLMKNGFFLIQGTIPGIQPVTTAFLLKVIDEKGTINAEFCLPVDFGEVVTNQVGNSIYFVSLPDGGSAVSFSYQNRIEKYSADDKLVWRADRPLGYDTKVIEKGKFESTGNMTSYTGPKMNRCSNGIAVDHSGRFWVVTNRRQIKPEEMIQMSQSGGPSGVTTKRVGDTDLRTTDMFQLDVFDPEGVLLGTIPLTQFVDGIWIFKDHLYLLDRDHGVTYYQYRIVER